MDTTRTPPQRVLNGNERRVIGIRGSGEGSFINKCSTSPSSRNDGGCWNDEKDGYVKLAANSCVVLECHSHGARLCRCDSDGTAHCGDSTVLYRDSDIKQTLCNYGNIDRKVFRVFPGSIDKAGKSGVEVNKDSKANGFHWCDHNEIISQGTLLSTVGNRELWKTGECCCVYARSSKKSCKTCGEYTPFIFGCRNKTLRNTQHSDGAGDGITTLKNYVNNVVCNEEKNRETFRARNIYSAWPTNVIKENNGKRIRRKSNENCLNNSCGWNGELKSRKAALRRDYSSKFPSFRRAVHTVGSLLEFTKLKTLNKWKNKESKEKRCFISAIQRKHIVYSGSKDFKEKVKFKGNTAPKSVFSFDREKSNIPSKYIQGKHRLNKPPQHPHRHFHSFVSNKPYSGPWKTDHWRQVTPSTLLLQPPQSSSDITVCSLPCDHSIYWQSVNLSSVSQADRAMTSPIFDNNPTLCSPNPLLPSTSANTMTSNHPPPQAADNVTGPLGLSNTNTFPIRDRTVSSNRSSDNRQCYSGSPPLPQNNNGEKGVGVALSGIGTSSSSRECGTRNRGGKDGDRILSVTGNDGDGGADLDKTIAYVENKEEREDGGRGSEKQLPVNMENKHDGKREVGGGKDGPEQCLLIEEKADMIGNKNGEEGEKEDKVMAPSVRKNLSHSDGVTTEVNIDSKTGSSHDRETKVHSDRGLSPDSRASGVDAESSVGVTVSCSYKDSSSSGRDEDDEIIVLNSDYLSSGLDVFGVGVCKDSKVLEAGKVAAGSIDAGAKLPIGGIVQDGETKNSDDVADKETKLSCEIGGDEVIHINTDLSVKSTIIKETKLSCDKKSDKNNLEPVQCNQECLSDQKDVNICGNSEDDSAFIKCEKQNRLIQKTATENGDSKETGSVKEDCSSENSGQQRKTEIKDKHNTGRISTVYANYPDSQNIEPNRSNNNGQFYNSIFSTSASKDNIVLHPLPSHSFTPCEGVRQQRPQSITGENPSHRLSHQYLNGNCCLSGTPFTEFSNQQPLRMVLTSAAKSDANYIDKPLGQGSNVREMPLNTFDKNCREDSKLLQSPKRHTPINKHMESVNTSNAILLPKNHHYYNYNSDFFSPVIISSLKVATGKGGGREINFNQHQEVSNVNQNREYLCDMNNFCPMYNSSMDNGVRKPLPMKPAFQTQTAPTLFQHNPSYKLGPYYNQNQHTAFCDQCPCCIPSSDELLCNNSNFVSYQQQHPHFYQLQKQHQQLQQQQNQHQHPHLQQQRPHHQHSFVINNHDSWITEFNFVCFRHKFSFTPIALLWTLFSLLISASCLMSFTTPYWMTHPDHAHSFGLINLCIADPQYLRNRPLCIRYGEQYFKYNYQGYHGHSDVNKIITTRNNQTFFDRLENIGSASFGEIPSRAWRTACLMFGAGCVLELLGAVTAAITLVLWEPWRCKVTRINGYMQSVAVVLLFLGIMVFPAGFDSSTYTYYCHSLGQSYNSGQCSMGWSYIMAVITFTLSIFCPVLAWLGTSPELRHGAYNKEYA